MLSPNPVTNSEYALTSNLGLLERSRLETMDERKHALGIELVTCSKGHKTYVIPKIMTQCEIDKWCRECSGNQAFNVIHPNIAPVKVVRRTFYRYFLSWFVIIYGYVTRSFGAFMAVASIALLMSVNNQVPGYIQSMLFVGGDSTTTTTMSIVNNGTVSSNGTTTTTSTSSGIVSGKNLRTDIVNWLIYGGILIGVGMIMLLLWSLEWCVYRQRELRRQLKRQRYTFLEKQVFMVNPYAVSHEYDYWSEEEDNPSCSDPDCYFLNSLLDEANPPNLKNGTFIGRGGGGGGGRRRLQELAIHFKQRLFGQGGKFPEKTIEVDFRGSVSEMAKTGFDRNYGDDGGGGDGDYDGNPSIRHRSQQPLLPIATESPEHHPGIHRISGGRFPRAARSARRNSAYSEV